MPAAPQRPDEAAALAALQQLQVLDSDPEPEFDALVRAAAAVCGTPVSAISLIDEHRQWFKASTGLPGVAETPRDVAFCAHAVLGNSLFEVPDAALDARFADNPLVTGQPGIRFYAAAPVCLSGSEHVGTLCVIDHQPRVLSDSQREVLGCLAQAVARALEGRQARMALQRANQALAASENRMRQMHEATPAMLHSVDANGRLLSVSDVWLAKLGYTRSEVLGRPSVDFLTSASRAHALQTVLPTFFATGRVDEVEYQMLTKDGRVMDVLLSGILQRDSAGQPLRSLAVMEDITERLRSQRETELLTRNLRAILDGLPSQIGYWDANLINQVANQAYQTWFGQDPERLRGTHMRQLLGEALYARSLPYLQAALAGQAQSFYESIDATADGRAARHAMVNYLPDVVKGEVCGIYTLVHDVTELVEGRLKLAAAQRDNLALITTLHHHKIVSMADPSGIITDVNDNFCRISGYSRAELVGQNHRTINSGMHPPEFWVTMWRTISSGQSWHADVCNRAKDGSLYWVDSIVTPFMGADGKIEKYISIRRDITAQKSMEAALRATNERMELAVESAGMGVWVYDVLNNILEWDDRMYQIFGRIPADHLDNYMLWSNSLHPDDRQRSEKALADAMHGAEHFQGEFRIIRPDGDVRHVSAYARIERDANGNAVRMTGVNIDITERARAEAALRKTTVLLRTVLDSATNVAIIATESQNLTMTMFNVGAENLLGYQSEELVGKVSPSIFHDIEEVQTSGQALSKKLGRSIENAEVFIAPEILHQAREWTYIAKNGRRFPVSLTISPMTDEDGAVVGYLGIAHDVSLHKALERSLRDALSEAKQASLSKSQFLANMSHEIRTPMNAVMGLSYLMERTPLDGEQMALIDKIKVASKSLLGIINDILDLSKIESANLHIEQTPFDLRGVIQDMEALVAPQAHAKALALHMALEPDLPPTLMGDPTRLHQILTNLLSNAVKFTQAGGVSLRVARVASSSPATARLRFTVQDSGIGIAPEVLPRLFTPFVQADTSTTRRFGGTGLGLSIVKQLVNLMGGELGVSSTEQVGSEFWVELSFAIHDAPTALAPPTEETQPIGRQLVGVRVLIADDSTINLEVARRILELEGAHVSLAQHGQEALDLLAAQPQGFDLVLMDVQMPVLDGYACVQRIRGELALTTLPVIALSAGALTSEQALAKESGMSDFVSKPFDPPALVRCIRRHLRAAPDTSPAPAPRAPGAQDWPHIDGIDSDYAALHLCGDVPLFLKMLKRFLADFGDMGGDVMKVEHGTLHMLSARLHNLKGTAGTLGAKTIQRLATDAEEACKAQQLDRVAPLILRLADALHHLGESAAAALAHIDEPSEQELATPAAPFDAQALRDLIELLRNNNLDAIEQFAKCGPQLRQQWGNDIYMKARAQIEGLAFAQALETLSNLHAADTPGAMSVLHHAQTPP